MQAVPSGSGRGPGTGQRRSIPDKFTTRINDVAGSPVGHVLLTRPTVQQVDLALVTKADYLSSPGPAWSLSSPMPPRW